MSWGQEVLVDCRRCNDNIKNKRVIEGFIAELCDRIGMVAVGKPVLVHVDDLGDKNGWTAFQMIKTSAIVAHFCDSGDAFFDVFSCKDIDQDTVETIIYAWFSPLLMRAKKVDRGEW